MTSFISLPVAHRSSQMWVNYYWRSHVVVRHALLAMRQLPSLPTPCCYLPHDWQRLAATHRTEQATCKTYYQDSYRGSMPQVAVTLPSASHPACFISVPTPTGITTEHALGASSAIL